MRRTRREALTIGFVLLGPAVAWLAALGLSYAVADAVCSLRRSGHPAGLSVPVTVLALNVVLAAVTVVAGWVAFHLWRRSRPGSPDARTELDRFAGLVGVGLAAVFLLGVALLAVNPVVFWSC